MKFAENFLKKIPSIPKDSIPLILKDAKIRTYSKGEDIIKIDQYSRKLYIVKSGIIRSYVLNNKGNEFIRTFYTRNTAFAPLSSLLNKKPSKIGYGCLSDSEVVEIDFWDFKNLTESNHKIALSYIGALEQIVLKREEKIYNLSVLSTTERYLKLKEQIPKIESLVAQYHIASYLSITPVQLSRIRRKLINR